MIFDFEGRTMDTAAAYAEADFACNTIPFFVAMAKELGVGPGPIGAAEFGALPYTTKADYRRGFPVGMVNPDESIGSDLTFTSRSSGTTGDRLTTVVHRHTLAERMMTTASLNPAFAEVLADADNTRIVRLAAPNCSDVECATPLSTIADRTMPDGTLIMAVAHDVLATPQTMLDQIIDEMFDYDPGWLYADPTHLALVCERMAERGIRELPGGAVVLAYSLCARPAVRAVTAMCPPDRPVVEVLSMSETGWYGMECRAGRRHLNTESFYYEFLPAGDGPFVEVVMTSIGDRLSPRIRYRTGDILELVPGTCPCGSAEPAAVHHGRLSAALQSGSGLVSTRMLDDLLSDFTDIRFYRVDQNPNGSVRCRLMVHEPSDDGLVERVRKRLADVFEALDVDVAAVSYIEAARSGKFTYSSREAG